ncbi:transposase [Streptomyces sp. 1222.5]|uniref:transposase n=1 Tax=Streptomyces sp. 1222.5 TaxID=1881026 RepID=UPI003F4A0D19
MRVRDHLAEVFDDALFVGAFPGRGAPAQSPALLALVTVLQFTENLTDRQAAEAARDRLSWKYALGAELSDTGFDFCALSRFRARLAGGGMERVLFDRLLEHCRGAGLVKAGGKQRTDSTHVVSAVRDLNRTELAGESVRAALETLAVAAPSWLAEGDRRRRVRRTLRAARRWLDDAVVEDQAGATRPGLRSGRAGLVSGRLVPRRPGVDP